MSATVLGASSIAKELSARLAEPRWGPYPAPRYDGFSVPNVAVSAKDSVTGRPPAPGAGPEREGRLPGLAPIYPSPGETGTSVVFLIDSFGWRLLEGVAGAARTVTERTVLSSVMPQAMPLTTVFPSTTSSTLISLSTGTSPGRHGIVGYTEYFPAWGTILNTLKFTPSWGGPRDLAVGKGFKPSDMVDVPTLFRDGLPTVALTKADFEGSAFTKLLYDGATLQGYVGLSDLAMHLKKVLSLPSRKRPPLVWVYWDLLDAVHHVNGPLEELAVREVTHLFLTLASVASGMPPQAREGVTLRITGDHGQIGADASLAVPAHEDPRLLSLLRRPPSGERRAAFLEARIGRKTELAAYLQAKETQGWVHFPVDEVIRGGLLGPEPHHPELADRLGDFLWLPPPGAALYYRPPGSRGSEEHFLRGAHGGLTPEELLVPLVTLTLDDLAGWNL